MLIRVYIDAGLSELARACGYLPKSVGTNFKRTHHFFLEVWESLFRVLMSFYLSKHVPPDDDLLKCGSQMIDNFPRSELQQSALRNLNEMLGEISDIMTRNLCDFSTFIDSEAQQNSSLQFWCRFLFQDCLAYIALYRSGNWDLRVAALKQMAAPFTAFDRPEYSKLIPHHLVEMLTIPRDVLTHLKQGGFTVSILGRPCHSIGIDESHEMYINKECKEFITRPSADYINRIATFLPIRTTAINNLEEQIFADRKSKAEEQITSLHATDPESKKHETNVNAQINKLQSDTSTFPAKHSQSTELQHLFNHKPLTKEQTHDLMNFRDVGQNQYERYIDYYVLRTPSVKPPKHRKSLLTFTERRTRQKKGLRLRKKGNFSWSAGKSEFPLQHPLVFKTICHTSSV